MLLLLHAFNMENPASLYNKSLKEFLPQSFLLNCISDTEIIRELKHGRFRDADDNRKWAVLTFNLPPHSHIHIAKYLFSIRDE